MMRGAESNELLLGIFKKRKLNMQFPQYILKKHQVQLCRLMNTKVIQIYVNMSLFIIQSGVSMNMLITIYHGSKKHKSYFYWTFRLKVLKTRSSDSFIASLSSRCVVNKLNSKLFGQLD
ncbi:hypothetical protein H311_00206 [Anncaliia algerae PRA109]|nr:hypothetical protein H311_00206 [Anncaliia algerae PRA109]